MVSVKLDLGGRRGLWNTLVNYGRLSIRRLMGLLWAQWGSSPSDLEMTELTRDDGACRAQLTFGYPDNGRSLGCPLNTTASFIFSVFVLSISVNVKGWFKSLVWSLLCFDQNRHFPLIFLPSVCFLSPYIIVLKLFSSMNSFCHFCFFSSFLEMNWQQFWFISYSSLPFVIQIFLYLEISEDYLLP